MIKLEKYGIEKVFENYLRGEDGKKQIDMSVDGTVTGEYTSQEAIGGSDVVLTIDANLQRITEEQLRINIEKIRNGEFGQAFPAEKGVAIVTNVKTGEILAMASCPDIDPSAFYNGISQAQYDEYNSQGSFLNRATQEIYPPGSIFKMVTAVAGLESGTIGTKDLINDNGPYIIETNDPNYKPQSCWYYNDYGRGHGRLNVSGALQKSCNYFFYDVGVRMGIDTLADWANYFGLGRKTGLEITEHNGILAQRSTLEATENRPWSAVDTASSSIGQGLNTFTPVQMAKYISMIANGGHPVDLTVVKSVINANGSQVSKEELDSYLNKKINREVVVTEDRNISESTIRAVHEGMLSATEEHGGTATAAFENFAIEVAGKTGSAERTTGRKDENDAFAWFAGFAPYDDPEIAVVVMVEKGGHGSYTAEAVREIMSEYFGMNMEEIVEPMTATTEMESFR